MHNFKKYMYPVLFLAVILCINEILMLALKPYTCFRNDMHKLETNQYDDLFVGTSHGKAGINPEIVDKITGEKSLNLCLGGEEVQDSYYIIKEACRCLLYTSSYESADVLEIQIRGPGDILDQYKISDNVSIDLKNYQTAGTYTVPVTVGVPDGCVLESTVSVNVILEEK